jgi:hypothetical protein
VAVPWSSNVRNDTGWAFVGLTGILHLLEASIDRAFRSAAVGRRPQAPDKAGTECPGLARRVKRVCPAIRNASLTTGCRTHWRQSFVATGNKCTPTNGQPYSHEMFGLNSSPPQGYPRTIVEQVVFKGRRGGGQRSFFHDHNGGCWPRAWGRRMDGMSTKRVRIPLG